MSAPRHAMVLLRCLLLERMISEQLVVMPMDVHVYVKLELKMMGLVTRLIIKAIICTDLVHLVSITVILPTENVDFTLENNRYNMKGIRIDVIFTSTATTTTTRSTLAPGCVSSSQGARSWCRVLARSGYYKISDKDTQNIWLIILTWDESKHL